MSHTFIPTWFSAATLEQLGGNKFLVSLVQDVDEELEGFGPFALDPVDNESNFLLVCLLFSYIFPVVITQ